MAETSNDEPLEPDAGNADEGSEVLAMRFPRMAFLFLDRIYRINAMKTKDSSTDYLEPDYTDLGKPNLRKSAKSVDAYSHD